MMDFRGTVALTSGTPESPVPVSKLCGSFVDSPNFV